MSNIDLSQLISADTKLTQARAQRMAELADLRWRHETGGITLPDGTRVLTTRDCQAQLSSAVQMMKSGLMSGPVDWKLESGWQQLSAEQIETVATAVLAHVRTCFAVEKNVAFQMENTPGDLSDFDIHTAFEMASADVTL
jgi:hypothetical protein